MTGRRKIVAIANLGDTFSERAQNIIESATEDDPTELLSRKVGWSIESASKRNIIRFHITQKTRKNPQQVLIIKKMLCEPTNGLRGKLINLIFDFANEHCLSVTFDVEGLPEVAARYVEKTYRCERTGTLLIYTGRAA